MAFVWIAACLAGLALRGWNLPDQIVGGDELHAVRAALRSPVSEIVHTYSQADPCIPMAVFYRLVLDLRGYLDEVAIRLPALCSGLLALLVIPWLAWRRVGSAGALLLAWMVALSPLLVLYSRLARPYMPIVLLSFVAFMAFDRWAEEGRKRWAVLWALSSGLAVWFHLVTAPFVLAPWLFEVLRKALGRPFARAWSQRRSGGPGGHCLGRQGDGAGDAQRGLSWSELVGFGLLAGLAILLLVGPALGSLVEVLGAKRGESKITAPALLGVWYLQAGTASAVGSVLFWVLTLVGFARLFARQRLFAARSLFAVAAQCTAVWVLSPHAVSYSLVLNRYWLVAYPVLLCWWVSAFALGQRRRLVTVAAVAAVVMALVSGPLVSRDYATSSFTQSNDYVAFHQPLPEPIELPVALTNLPRPGPLLVFPWSSRWRLSRSLAGYQRLLNRSIVVSSPEPALNLPALRFRNLSAAHPRDFLASRARYLVVFLDVADEEERWGGERAALALKPRLAEHYRQEGQRMARLLEEWWGSPIARDERVVVWDLETLRSEASDQST